MQNRPGAIVTPAIKPIRALVSKPISEENSILGWANIQDDGQLFVCIRVGEV